jgi:hypothetical protein
MREGNLRKALNVGGVGICMLGAFIAIRFLRRQWIEHKEHEHRVHLFREATISAEWTGSDGEIRAIRELGDDPSDEAEQMLIDLASHAGLLDGSAQREAISELAKRNDPNLPPFLAGLIQPATLLDSRMAAAQALQSRPCNAQCTRSLLSYLNRIDSGEVNVEQQGLDKWGTDLRKSIEATTMPQEQRIYALVYAVLLHSPDTTNSLLRQDYGLGSAAPKQFAIAFVTKANSAAFCPALIQSERQIASPASTQQSLIEVLKSLKCIE